MKSITIKAAELWKTLSKQRTNSSLKTINEFDRNLHSIFSVGDYYYYVFNLPGFCFDFMSDEFINVMGYNKEDCTVPFLLSKIHPDDQAWFLNFEAKVAEFFADLSLNQIPNYKIRYDYRMQKADGNYIRILQQVVTIDFDEKGAILRTLGIHTDITHLKKEGLPLLSFIGLNGEPSYIDVKVDQIFPAVEQNILSKREIEILKLLVNGLSTKQIAKQLFISVYTVNNHRKHILEKTNSSNTPDLVSKAIKNGWV